MMPMMPMFGSIGPQTPQMAGAPGMQPGMPMPNGAPVMPQLPQPPQMGHMPMMPPQPAPQQPSTMQALGGMGGMGGMGNPLSAMLQGMGGGQQGVPPGTLAKSGSPFAGLLGQNKDGMSPQTTMPGNGADMASSAMPPGMGGDIPWWQMMQARYG